MRLLINMEQQIAKWHHTYHFNVNGIKYLGKANRRLALEKRKISLFDSNENEIALLIEKSSITPLLEKIPILNWFIPIYFNCDVNGTYKGEIKVPKSIIQDKFFTTIDDKKYVCYYHTGGLKGDVFSIYQDGLQIGMVRKSKLVEWNAHSYIGEFENNTDIIYNLIFMALIDVLWFTDDLPINETIYTRKYEAYWGLDRIWGKKPNLKWRPKEKNKG
jgi:hypothetical protein